MYVMYVCYVRSNLLFCPADVFQSTKLKTEHIWCVDLIVIIIWRKKIHFGLIINHELTIIIILCYKFCNKSNIKNISVHSSS